MQIKVWGLTAVAVFSAGAGANELARVTSAVALQEQYTVPRQVCRQEQVTTPGSTSGAGAVMGAVAGGALGNQVGQGTGRAAATALGLIGGAVLGNRIEGPGAPKTDMVQRCYTENVVETRVRGYMVNYEYAGKSYQIEMPYDPGATLPVQVKPVLAAPPAQANTYSSGPSGTGAYYSAPAGMPQPVMPVGQPRY